VLLGSLTAVVATTGLWAGTAGATAGADGAAGAREQGQAASGRQGSGELLARLADEVDANGSPLPTQAGGRSKAVCQAGAVSDPVGDGVGIDALGMAVARDCATDTWALSWQAAAPWTPAQLDTMALFIDSDDNVDTGCDGYDYAIGADAISGAMFQTPTCDGDWPEISGLQALVHDGDRTAGFVWSNSAIGNPTGRVAMYFGVAALSGSVVDYVPDAGDLWLDAPSEVLTTTQTNPNQPAPAVPAAPAAPAGPLPTFSNGRCDIPLDETATNNSVARLYEAYFRRPADGQGLLYWVPKFRSGELCLTDISEYFAQSAEFVSTYGPLGIPEFVRLVYVNVMGREPDPAGYEFWATRLSEGMRRGTMMVGFSESPEFRSRTGLV
jgi:hypothetical protein